MKEVLRLNYSGFRTETFDLNSLILDVSEKTYKCNYIYIKIIIIFRSKMKLSYKHFTKIIILMIILAIVSVQAVTYVPAPTITPVNLFSMPFTNPTTTIRSSRLEALEITYNGAGNTTSLKISIFNRS